MVNSSRTFIATPPGATIKEQLEDRGMSQKEFAKRMGISEKHISHLVNGEVQLTSDMAYRLETVLGIPASFWNNLEAIYRDKLAKVEAENQMDDDIEFAKKMPYRQLSKAGSVPAATRWEDKVINLRRFFEVVSLEKLYNNDLIPQVACRRLAITEKADFALIAWAQQAKIEARNIEVEEIDIKSLKNYLPKIREMTNKDPSVFCPDLRKLLASCGVAIVFLPHMDGSFLHGATFYDKNKIVIGLTVRGKDADKFWFSLFHEIAHIVLGHLDKPLGTDEKDEKEADEFAKEILIPNDCFTSFVNANSFTARSIRSFAQDIGIDAGIVVGRLQKEGYIDFSRHNNIKTRYEIV